MEKVEDAASATYKFLERRDLDLDYYSDFADAYDWKQVFTFERNSLRDLVNINISFRYSEMWFFVCGVSGGGGSSSGGVCGVSMLALIYRVQI